MENIQFKKKKFETPICWNRFVTGLGGNFFCLNSHLFYCKFQGFHHTCISMAQFLVSSIDILSNAKIMAPTLLALLNCAQSEESG